MFNRYQKSTESRYCSEFDSSNNTDHPIVKIDLDEKIENGDFEKFENFFRREKFYLLI